MIMFPSAIIEERLLRLLVTLQHPRQLRIWREDVRSNKCACANFNLRAQGAGVVR